MIGAAVLADRAALELDDETREALGCARIDPFEQCAILAERWGGRWHPGVAGTPLDGRKVRHPGQNAKMVATRARNRALRRARGAARAGVAAARLGKTAARGSIAPTVNSREQIPDA